jgi:hemerythrin-like domain-containing protein
MRITDALVAEHRIFRGVFDQIDRVLPSLTSPAEVRTMAGVVRGMLEAHADAEANLAYLALDHVLHQKGQLERMHQDHREIDSRLEQAHLAKTSIEGRRLLKAALNSAREHFRLEERVLFPLLEKVLQPDTLEALGGAWLQRLKAPELAAEER